jgi:hypothetical protein
MMETTKTALAQYHTRINQNSKSNDGDNNNNSYFASNDPNRAFLSVIDVARQARHVTGF